MNRGKYVAIISYDDSKRPVLLTERSRPNDRTFCMTDDNNGHEMVKIWDN